MKYLKKMKKMVAAMLLAGIVSTMGAAVVYAAGYAEKCPADSRTVICTGPMYSHLTGAHQVKVPNTNTTVLCEVTEVYGRHDVDCSSPRCTVHPSTEIRVCAQYHTCDDCISDTGMCQY